MATVCDACLKLIEGRHVEAEIQDSMKRKPDRTIVLHVECAGKHKMLPDDPPQWGDWPMGFGAPAWRKVMTGLQPAAEERE